MKRWRYRAAPRFWRSFRKLPAHQQEATRQGITQKPAGSAVVSLSVAGLVAGIVFFSLIDAYQANLRYILWKHHAWPYQEFMLPFLSVDGEFTMSLNGKSRAEIQRYFPMLIPPDRAVGPSQQYYSRQMIEQGRDCLWIGDSNFAVQFEKGRVVYVGPIKG